MAGKSKKVSAEQKKALDDACQQAFGIDWQAFLAKLEALVVAGAGPFIQALVQALLAALSKQQPKAAGASAKGEQCVCCHEVLCSALQHTSLCAEMCYTCDVYG